MTRLISTLVCDARVQFRNGFYYASALLALFFIVILISLTRGESAFFSIDTLAWLMPVILLTNLMTNTFYFLAGLVLFEKDEGTLEAQTVSPLRPHEYLLSKLVTLTGLTVVENGAVVLLVFGSAVRWMPWIAAVVLGSSFFALCGFIAIVRYRSINEFLMPSILWTIAIAAPVFPYFGLAPSPYWALHPAHAALTLFEASLFEASAGKIAYGVIYSSAWVFVLFIFALRRYDQFVVAAGARPA